MRNVRDLSTKLGEGFNVGQFNGVIQIGPRLTPVAIVTKISAYCHNSLASVVQVRATVTLDICHCHAF